MTRDYESERNAIVNSYDPTDRLNDDIDENDPDDWTSHEPDGDEDDDPRERLWQAVYRLESEVEYIKREHDATEYRDVVLKLKSQLADMYEKLSEPIEPHLE